MTNINNRTFDEERALYGSRGVELENCRFDGPADGESALKEARDVKVKDCFFNLRYPFWHDTDLLIDGSELTPNCRAALWYSERVTIRDSRLHGIKALRECADAKLVNCRMVDTDLAFEKSEVEAVLTAPIDSIKNPRAGSIRVPAAGEIILDDPEAKAEILIG